MRPEPAGREPARRARGREIGETKLTMRYHAVWLTSDGCLEILRRLCKIAGIGSHFREVQESEGRPWITHRRLRKLLLCRREISPLERINTPRRLLRCARHQPCRLTEVNHECFKSAAHEQKQSCYGECEEQKSELHKPDESSHDRDGLTSGYRCGVPARQRHPLASALPALSRHGSKQIRQGRPAWSDYRVGDPGWRPPGARERWFGLGITRYRRPRFRPPRLAGWYRARAAGWRRGGSSWRLTEFGAALVTYRLVQPDAGSVVTTEMPNLSFKAGVALSRMPLCRATGRAAQYHATHLALCSVTSAGVSSPISSG